MPVRSFCSATIACSPPVSSASRIRGVVPFDIILMPEEFLSLSGCWHANATAGIAGSSATKRSPYVAAAHRAVNHVAATSLQHRRHQEFEEIPPVRLTMTHQSHRPTRPQRTAVLVCCSSWAAYTTTLSTSKSSLRDGICSRVSDGVWFFMPYIFADHC